MRDVTSALREPLSPEQEHLLRAIYEPFDQSGEWPIWQYVDLTLDDRFGLDAGVVLASLPSIEGRGAGSMGYGLIWRTDSYMQPQPEKQIALTIAGLRHVPEAGPLLGAFLATIQYLVEQQRKLIPSPREVVEASVRDAAIAEQVLTASFGGAAAPPLDFRTRKLVDPTMNKLRQLLGHEPFLYNVAAPLSPPDVGWTVRVPAVLRAYRGVATIDDYLDRVDELVAPAALPTVPPSFGALDIPYAIGYLDAVWKSRTGSYLFVNLDPASTARLTQPCADEADFNSLMSALADVLGQVVPPGKTTPAQGGALEEVCQYLTSSLDADAADRVATAIGTLIHLRRIRVSTQHRDARHRAVAAFKEIGMPFPPASWEGAWAHVAVLAKGALDELREEIHAGL